MDDVKIRSMIIFIILQLVNFLDPKDLRNQLCPSLRVIFKQRFSVKLSNDCQVQPYNCNFLIQPLLYFQIQPSLSNLSPLILNSTKTNKSNYYNMHASINTQYFIS